MHGETRSSASLTARSSHHGPAIRRALLVLLLLLVLPVSTGLAQDTHYWNLAYGTRSTLLGGAVIGSVSDLSATYYNPGALGLNPAGGLILSAGVYEGNFYTLKGPDSLKTNLTSFRVNPAPSYLAGRLPSDSLIGERLTYSLITRQSMRLDLQGRSVERDGSFLGLSRARRSGFGERLLPGHHRGVGRDLLVQVPWQDRGSGCDYLRSVEIPDTTHQISARKHAHQPERSGGSRPLPTTTTSTCVSSGRRGSPSICPR